MITINFHPNGEAVSDWKISEYVDHIISQNLSCTLSTIEILTEIRARIVEGAVSHEDYEFFVWAERQNECLHIKLNKYAVSDNLNDATVYLFTMSRIGRILRGQSEKRKRKNERENNN